MGGVFDAIFSILIWILFYFLDLISLRFLKRCSKKLWKCAGTAHFDVHWVSDIHHHSLQNSTTISCMYPHAPSHPSLVPNALSMGMHKLTLWTAGLIQFFHLNSMNPHVFASPHIYPVGHSFFRVSNFLSSTFINFHDFLPSTVCLIPEATMSFLQFTELYCVFWCKYLYYHLFLFRLTSNSIYPRWFSASNYFVSNSKHTSWNPLYTHTLTLSIFE